MPEKPYEIGSEFNYESAERGEDLLSLFRGRGDVRFMRCGRDAIGLIAEDIRLKRQPAGKPGDAPETAGAEETSAYMAFLPALSCDSMVLPFRVHGFEVHFYALREDLAPDLQSLQELLRQKMQSRRICPAVLLMNLFGSADIHAAAEQIRIECPSAVIIEDITHLLFNPEKQETHCADYLIGSIRKWLGVPDGAAAVSLSGAFRAEAEQRETAFTTFRAEALRLKTEYLRTGDPDTKKKFRALFSQAEQSLDDGMLPAAMSEQSRRYLSCIDMDRIRSRRTANYHALYRALTALPENARAFRMLPELPETTVPFMLPVVLQYADEEERVGQQPPDTQSRTELSGRDAFEKQLAARNLYMPVLWPIAEEAAACCSVSRNFSEHMLAFWIDQRYGPDDMLHAAAVFAEELRKEQISRGGEKCV